MQDLLYIRDIVPAHTLEDFRITAKLQDLLIIELDVIDDDSVVMRRTKNAVGTEGNDATIVG